MTERIVKFGTNLEPRPAALFVQAASKYKSHILVKIDDKMINAKSIMGMISLNIFNSQDVTIIADGDDEKEAVNELSLFLERA